ncbi:MAG: hypothetical protein ACKV0T_04200 [Planctomycetales bacterium]
MVQFSSEEFVKGRLVGMRVITLALAAGLLSFLALALAVIRPEAKEDALTVAYVAVGFAVTALAARSLIGGMAVAAQRKQLAAGRPTGASGSDADRLLNVYMSQHILQSALLEGPGFFLVVAYIVTGQTWLLAVVALLAALLLAQFPTRDRVENWAERQLELMELEKQSP